MTEEKVQPVDQKPLGEVGVGRTSISSLFGSSFKKHKRLMEVLLSIFIFFPFIVGAIFFVKYPDQKAVINIDLSHGQKTSPTRPQPTPEFIKDQLVVKYKLSMGPGEILSTREAEIDNLFKELGVVSKEKIYQSTSSALKNYYLLNIETTLNLNDIIDRISALSEVENVEKNYINKTD